MAVIRPHINPKTGKEFTNAEYCRVIVDVYENAVKEYEANTDPNKGEFVSPLGGKEDEAILKFARAINAIENDYEREKKATDLIIDKTFLQRLGAHK